MLLEFDSDQRLWRDTIRDVVAKECSPAFIRSVVDGGVDPAPLWKLYNKLGWTELTDRADTVELAIVLEELGRATDPTPYLATMTQFAPLVPGHDLGAAAGAAIFSGVNARRDGAGWILDGTAKHVLDGDRADRIAVVTPAGTFVVRADQVLATRTQVFDPALHIAEVSFAGVRADAGDRTDVDVSLAMPVALTGLALTTVGACQRVLDMVLEHVKSRQQFGVPIGSFQAVKHKAADMHVAIERARALSYYAALTIAAGDDRACAVAASMAKASAGECQSLVFRHGLQLHGAMGFTWENDLQFALKRAKSGELLLGGAAEHRGRIFEERHAVDI
jgi:alkylation response protein AidB-like acyl-CoA dehydrogenase